MSDIAAVIVTFNRREVVLESVRRLMHAQVVPHHVIVVDNASLDGTAEAIRSAFPSVEVLQLDSNLGPAAAFGRGMRHAVELGAGWVMVLNDDCFVEAETLARLAEAGRGAEERVAIVAPATRHGGEVNLGYLWRHWPVALMEQNGARNGALQVDMVTFTGALIRTALVSEVGTPRGDYFIMWWEWEYCLRLRRAGYRILMVPEASVGHGTLGSGTRASPPWRGYYQARNHLRFALDGRSMVDGLFWLLREAKFMAGILVYMDLKAERLRLRVQGAIDAIRGRMGPRVMPGRNESRGRA